MSLGVVSLAALILAIVIGVMRKINVGILCIGMALVLSVAYQLKTGDIMKGFSTSLFLTMTGVTYLFAILSQNDALTILAAKIVRLAGKRKMPVYVMMFVSGFLICAAGPGAIPSLAVIPVLAVPIARSSGLNPILLCLAGQMGVQSGRMSPITPEAVVVMQLMNDQGLAATSAEMMPLIYCMLFTEILLFTCCFFYFKGWIVNEPSSDVPEEGELTFSKEQWVTLLGLATMLILVLVFKMNVGLTSFLVGTVLVALGYGYEKAVVKGIPWDVILMVLGVGMLMHIMMISGGVNYLSDILASLMTSNTAAAVMVTTAGILSFFSSGLGVVFPTLIPTVSKIASAIPGVNPFELVAMIVIGGTVTGFSPVSTAGALIISAVSTDKDDKGADGGSQNILFRDLFVVAFLALIISAVAGILGVYLLFF